MMLFGGLRPIPSQLVLDSIALIGMGLSTYWNNVKKNQSSSSIKILLASFVLLVSTSGFTNRWTITFPMIVLTVIHFIQRLLLFPKFDEKNNLKGKSITTTTSRVYGWFYKLTIVLSIICVFAAGALTVLFPAVELPPINGPYNVGYVDFFVPLPAHTPVMIKERNISDSTTDDETCDNVIDEKKIEMKYVPVRLLYPTNAGIVPTIPRHFFGIPYIKPQIAIEFCKHSMKYGAPPPLQNFDWMIHMWRLIRLPIIPNAPVATVVDNSITNTDSSGLPMVMFSHGLGGSYDIYSYQTMSLASQGKIVVVLNHLDGSAPVVHQPTGMDSIPHDYNIFPLWEAGNEIEYTRVRRKQTDVRVNELIGVTEYLHQIKSNKSDKESDPLVQIIKPILNHWQTDSSVFMGHSFGGATALTASLRRPDLVKAIVAYDPAIDWMPDDARKSMFHDNRLNGLNNTYDGGTGGYHESVDQTINSYSIHDFNMLILNSHEWMEKDWGRSKLLKEMHDNGRLGNDKEVSKFNVVQDAYHNEFSDTCILTPLWIARPVGLTGPRNPIHTAYDIADITRSFIDNALSR